MKNVAVCCRPNHQRSRNRSCSKAARPTERFVGDWVSHGGGNWTLFVHNCRLSSSTPDWKVLTGVIKKTRYCGKDDILRVKNANI